MLFLKPEVEEEGVSREVWFALGVAAELKQRLFGLNTVVTSLKDGSHMAGSKHYTGQAGDLRTKDMTEAQARTWLEALKVVLDPMGFDVIFEGQGTPGSSGVHIHAEFDPKPGEGFLHRL